MAEFAFVAVDARGRERRGTIKAGNDRDARNDLSARKLHVIKVQPRPARDASLPSETGPPASHPYSRPDGRTQTIRVRSMVGLIPLFAVESLEPDVLANLPDFTRRMNWFLNYRPDLASLVSRWHEPWPRARRSCCWTNHSARSMRRCASSCVSGCSDFWRRRA